MIGPQPPAKVTEEENEGVPFTNVSIVGYGGSTASFRGGGHMVGGSPFYRRKGKGYQFFR
jgi:hypothetical protein